jgi:GTP-binding protein
MRDYYRRAEFMLSAAAVRQMPRDSGAEVAIAGRSNVGKSSFINVLTGIRKLARTSKTPGRTQLINFFALDEARRVVDLPGYGFARVPLEVKRQWQALIESYLTGRRSLRGVVLLMDVRHPLTPLDRQLLHWCRANDLPVLAVLTKADKLSRGRALQVLAQVRRELDAEFPEAAAELFSALRPGDTPAIYARLDGWLGLPQ